MTTNKNKQREGLPHMISVLLRTGAIAVLAVWLAGCATEIRTTHPLYEPHADVAAANVYFIRPFTYRERGVADNPVKIEVNKELLLELGKGEYTLVRLKPGPATITTRNLTMFTNKAEPVEMTRSIDTELVAGKTYFLHIEQVNEEFRGVYYLIRAVDLATAKGLVNYLRVVGPARDAPIGKLPAE